jgi:phospholipid/cholesterol/gamma-HCH transport system substrate-binding protein
VSQVTRAERIQAFLFVLIGLVVTALVVLALVGSPFARDPLVYFLEFHESVSGLNPGDPVLYKGVKYGKVASIEIPADDPEIVRMRLELQQDAPVRVSTTAVIKTNTILGPYHIELEASRATSPVLPAGSYITTATTTLSRLLATGESLGERLVGILDNLERWTGPEHEREFWAVIAEVHEALDTARESMDTLTPETLRLLRSWADLGDDLAGFLDQEMPVLHDLLADTAASAARLRRFLESGVLDDTADTARRSLARVTEELERDGAALRTFLDNNQVAPFLERATAALERFELDARGAAQELTKESRDLLRTDVAPTLSELRRAVNSLSRLIDTVQRQPGMLLLGRSLEERPLPGANR